MSRSIIVVLVGARTKRQFLVVLWPIVICCCCVSVLFPHLCSAASRLKQSNPAHIVSKQNFHSTRLDCKGNYMIQRKVSFVFNLENKTKKGTDEQLSKERCPAKIR
jgi:hypothetical protein